MKILIRIFKFLLNNILVPIIVGSALALLTGAASTIYFGNFLKLFGFVSATVWIIFIMIIFFWFVSAIIYSRHKRMSTSHILPEILISHTPLCGWVSIGELSFVGARWRVLTPAPLPWDEFDPLAISPSYIEIATPPRCPNCGTEIEESRNFWGKYIWLCVNCKWKVKHSKSYFYESTRAKKIAKRWWEKELENKLKQH